MTQRNKLIVGAVVVLGALYLYDRNKKMKAGAEATPLVTGGIKPPSTNKPDLFQNTLKADAIKLEESNFAMKPAPEKVFFQGDLKI